MSSSLSLSLFNGGGGACKIDQVILLALVLKQNINVLPFCLVFLQCHVFDDTRVCCVGDVASGFLFILVLGLQEKELKQNVLIQRLSFYCFSVENRGCICMIFKRGFPK